MERVGLRIGPPARVPLRARAISAIQRGPAGVVPAVAVTVLVASAAAVLILTFAVDGDQPALNDWVRGVAAALCALSGLVLLIGAVRSNRAAAPARAGAPIPPPRPLS